MVKHSKVTPASEVAINALLFAVRQAADIVCDRWALKLILAAFEGETRFGGFMEKTGMASRLATSRLQTLQDLGMLVRLPYSLRPLRHEYMLTVMGRDFLAVLLQMQRWEQNWTSDHRSSPIVHRACGKPLCSQLACGSCRQPANARDIEVRISEAQLRQMPAKQTVHRRSSVDGSNDADSHRFFETIFRIFGDKWSVEIINSAFIRVRRFGHFRQLSGMAPNILSDRLERLTAMGVFRKSDTSAREYVLTEAGVDLYGTLVALRDWADKWVPDRYKSPVQLIHRQCTKPFSALAICDACGLAIEEPGDLIF